MAQMSAYFDEAIVLMFTLVSLLFVINVARLQSELIRDYRRVLRDEIERIWDAINEISWRSENEDRED
jgi:hypothetical protein